MKVIDAIYRADSRFHTNYDVLNRLDEPAQTCIETVESRADTSTSRPNCMSGTSHEIVSVAYTSTSEFSTSLPPLSFTTRFSSFFHHYQHLFIQDV